MRLAPCVWPQMGTSNGDKWGNFWNENWLIVSGMCKVNWILDLKVFTCYFISQYFCPQQTAHRHLSQLQALKRPLMSCSDRKCKVKVLFKKAGWLQLHSLLPTAIHPTKCSPSHPWHSIQPNHPLYLCSLSLTSHSIEPNYPQYLCSTSHLSHSTQPNDPLYCSLCDAEQHTGLINCWFVIVIFDLLCLSVTIQTDTQPVLSTTSYCSFQSKQL